MTDRLKEIEARLAAATPGPWEKVGNAIGHTHTTPRPFCLIAETKGHMKNGPNAVFIAHAPSDIAYLLTEEGAREVLKRRAEGDGAEIVRELRERAQDYVTKLGHLGVKLSDTLEHRAADYIEAMGGVPAGWKLVPVEPTREMKIAAQNTYNNSLSDKWRAMLAASPAPPAADNGWQDISKLRHDDIRGTPVLLWFPFRNEGGCQFIGIWAYGSDDEPAWRDPDSGELLGDPTHWRELPTPPTEKDKA